MSIKIEIEKIKGGYILNRKEYGDNRELIFTTEELFEKLLQIFEGRANCFHENMYGKVIIERKESKK